MIPPKYSDIGKSAGDLLNKDYPVGIAKLEVKTTASNGVNFTVNGTQDSKSGVIGGELKAKYTDKANGLTVTDSWSSANVLGLEVEVADQLVKGSKLILNGSLLPAAGQRNAKVGLEYKQDYIFSNVSVDVFKGPVVSADAVVGAEGFVAGGEVAYNVSEGKIQKYNGVVGYSHKDYAVAVHALNSFHTFSASYIHRVSPDLEVGAKAIWDKKSIATNVAIEVGTKYALDKDTFVKAKINNAGLLGLGFTQTLRQGVKASLGGSFDTSRFNENAHKLGISLTFEA
jgi:voltage-dependent anion channel protein 2